MYYTETTGIILNCCIAVVSLILVGCSLLRMARESNASLGQISIWFTIILGLHVVGMLLSLGLPLLMAVMYDAGDRSLTYFSNNWLVIGLFVVPAIIGQVLPLTLYYTLKPNVSRATNNTATYKFNNYSYTGENKPLEPPSNEPTCPLRASGFDCHYPYGCKSKDTLPVYDVYALLLRRCSNQFTEYSP